MDTKYWKEKWKIGDTAFHQRSINRHLRKHFQKGKGKVFVPLCGKSQDMLWLVQKGHEVVGVEASDIACQEFFVESNLKYEISKQRSFSVYKSQHITIWCGDFFKLPAAALQGVTAMYDRAALIALPKPLRKKYVGHILKLLKAQKPLVDIHLLLLTIEYPQALVDGPPFSVSTSEVKTLYGRSLLMKCEKKIPVAKTLRSPKLKNISPLIEGIYDAQVVLNGLSI